MDEKDLEKLYKQVYKLKDGNYMVSTKSQDEVTEVDYWADLDLTAVYGMEGNWGLVDKDGNIIIQPKYIYPFLEHGENYQVMLPYRYKKIQGKEKIVLVKHGLIDKKGNVIIPIKYIYMEVIDNIGTYFKMLDPKTGRAGILDKDNKIVVPFEYDYISSPQTIKTDYYSIYPDNIYQVAVNKNNLFGVYDLKLKKEIIEPKYKYLKIIDYNKFLTGEDGFNCNTLIDENEHKIKEFIP